MCRFVPHRAVAGAEAGPCAAISSHDSSCPVGPVRELALPALSGNPPKSEPAQQDGGRL